ncbi:MAG: ATP-grasp domain-containing protein [Bacteroidota bacterium]
MRKKKLLMSGLGGSLFPYLHHQLVGKYDLFYVDSDSLLKNLYPDFNFFPAPLVSDDTYWDFISQIIQRYEIDCYIPLIDEEIVTAKMKFNDMLNYSVMTPTIEFSNLCLDKYALMHKLDSLGISSIKSYTGSEFKQQIPYPIFVKPNTGRGSRGIRKITSDEELNAYYLLEKYAPKDILIQELVMGTEYTVGVSTNNMNEILCISTKKIIRKRGITQVAVTENSDVIDAIATRIVNELKPSGPINVQLYVTESGDVKIFEINPRFSTTTIMSYAGGVDEISLYIENHNKQFSTSNLVRPKSGIILHRRWENCFYEEQ